jgi:diguanylate cyclase (GGDEF)-like protein
MQKLAELLSAQDLEKIFEHLHAAVAVIEKDGAFLAWNSAFEPYKNALGDVFPQKLSERNWVEEFSFDDSTSTVFCNLILIPASRGRFTLVVQPIASDSALTTQNGIEKLSKRVKLFQLESEFSKKLAHNKQVELEAVIAQAKEVSHTDPLTFLLNRRAMLQEIQDEVLRAERYKSLLSISVVDVDHFKTVNDSFGHSVGDEVLKRVARILRDSVRHPDIVGRYGGEEFLILLPNSDLKAAEEQAARLCKQMRETTIEVKENKIKVTLSVGLAQLRIGTEDWQAVLNRADNAMYKAKEKGRDGWVISE